MDTTLDETMDSEEELGGLDEDEDEELLVLVSADGNGREFEISREAAILCNFVKSILEGGMLCIELHAPFHGRCFCYLIGESAILWWNHSFPLSLIKSCWLFLMKTYRFQRQQNCGQQSGRFRPWSDRGVPAAS